MKALISTFELRETGYRVAQIVEDGQEFDVAPDLYWVDCDSEIKVDQVWYDPSDNSFKDFQIINSFPAQNQPTSTGTQNL